MEHKPFLGHSVIDRDTLLMVGVGVPKAIMKNFPSYTCLRGVLAMLVPGGPGLGGVLPLPL